MTRVLLRGIALGAFGGVLLFELLTGIVFFYGLGSGRGVNVAGAFVVTMQPNGGFLLSVTSAYLVGLGGVVVVFAAVAAALLARSHQRQASQTP